MDRKEALGKAIHALGFVTEIMRNAPEPIRDDDDAARSILRELMDGTARERACGEGVADKPCTEIERLQEDNVRLRKRVWLTHGCSIVALYGDDGEMQCRSCHIDFKRDPVKEIDEKLVAMALERINNMGVEVTNIPVD